MVDVMSFSQVEFALNFTATALAQEIFAKNNGATDTQVEQKLLQGLHQLLSRDSYEERFGPSILYRLLLALEASPEKAQGGIANIKVLHPLDRALGCRFDFNALIKSWDDAEARAAIIRTYGKKFNERKFIKS